MEALSRRIRRFRMGRWQVWRNTGLPADVDHIAAQLFKAFSCGLSVPDSPKQLRRITQDTETENHVRDAVVQDTKEERYG